MPSGIHQALALWIGRRMALDGFTVVAFDGPAERAGTWNLLPRCPSVLNDRADVIGIRPGARSTSRHELALGEAKTPHDLMSRRTRRQLDAFQRLAASGSPPMRLYLGIVASAVGLLERVLTRSGLGQDAVIVRVVVPDILAVES